MTGADLIIYPSSWSWSLAKIKFICLWVTDHLQPVIEPLKTIKISIIYRPWLNDAAFIRYKEYVKSIFARDIITLTESSQFLLEDLSIPIMFLEHHGANDPHNLSL